MTPQETLQQQKTKFETRLYEYMDRLLSTTTAEMDIRTASPQARRTLMQPVMALTDARDAYRQALRDAAPHVTQEVGEDYLRVARELPAQVSFLTSTLSAYQRRRIQGEAGE